MYHSLKQLFVYCSNITKNYMNTTSRKIWSWNFNLQNIILIYLYIHNISISCSSSGIEYLEGAVRLKVSHESTKVFLMYFDPLNLNS